MLLQAQGNGDSPAGLRLQRLCTELVPHIIKHIGQVCHLICFLPANTCRSGSSAHMPVHPAAQITVTAAMLMHDPTTKGRLHCMPLMSQPVSTPLAPPDSNFWHRVTVGLLAWVVLLDCASKSDCCPHLLLPFQLC